MIEILLVLILVFEVIRLVCYLYDAARIRQMNRRTEAAAAQAQRDWESLRRAELAELKELAKNSESLRMVYEDIKALLEVKNAEA